MDNKFLPARKIGIGGFEKHLAKHSKSKTEKLFNYRSINGGKMVYASDYSNYPKHLICIIENVIYPSNIIINIPYGAEEVMVLYSEQKKEMVVLSALQNIRQVLQTEYPETDYAKCPSYYCHKTLDFPGDIRRTGTLVIPCYGDSRIATSLADDLRRQRCAPIISSMEGTKLEKLPTILNSKHKHLKQRAEDLKTLAAYGGHAMNNMPSKTK